MDTQLGDALQRAAVPLDGAVGHLAELAAGHRFVLLGEATHGTHEFYRLRTEVTCRLITDHGFDAVAVEADWPDAYRANCWVRGRSDDRSPQDALGDFVRFPTWMWRNTDVVELLRRLREHNEATGDAGFYGLDLYSLYRSIEAVIGYLDDVDPDAAAVARDRYGCFERYDKDAQTYARAAGFGAGENCEDEVVQQLSALRQRAADYANRDGWIAEDEYFYAEQNARLVANAEEYYRTMFAGRVDSWNLRDAHMTDTLAALADYLGRRRGRPARVVVWAHNSHLGDARATELGESGEWNVGQLARERWGDEALLVGFTTATGTVTAASGWDAPAQRKRVRPPLEGGYERLFSDSGIGDALLDLRNGPLRESLPARALERAIGVIYLPQTERQSHYFHASLANQFDAVIHVEETTALEPLERTPRWDRGELPETYPSRV